VQYLSNNSPAKGKQVVMLVDEELPDFATKFQLAKEVYSISVTNWENMLTLL
jgi:hypothetical protein